ncbi:MAG: four helix bundle protein [Proteobacteria bacterium]|nr:four helix bundle protein [Pseudomonadota bacterium]
MLHEKLECYRRAVGLAEELSKEGARWPKGLAYLIDQQKRAMASVILNIAEGNARRSDKERRRFFEIARASAAEVSACVDLSCAFGLTNSVESFAVKSRLEEIAKMLWGLMR